MRAVARNATRALVLLTRTRAHIDLEDLAEAREPLALEMFAPALQHVLDVAKVQIAQALRAEGFRHICCGA
eukprot:3009542-Alexandrium_andersonii.AAC.1